MIREIRGKVLGVEADGAVVDVNGWGVKVCMATHESLVPGSEVRILTYLAFKQDGAELYGFSEEADRRFFELALLVPGVGPKTAISLLRRAPRESLEGAIGRRDVNYLTRVVGLGKKAAEKLIVELAEKIGNDGKAPVSGDDEVFDMLVALGYTEREARTALTKIPMDVAGTDARFKAALAAH